MILIGNSFSISTVLSSSLLFPCPILAFISVSCFSGSAISFASAVFIYFIYFGAVFYF
jgi:hypothetical protein